MTEKEIMIALEPLAKDFKSLALHTNKKRYEQWLAQTYYFVAHSIPLLEKAIANAKDPAFIERSKEHIKEETGHDKIALNDLKVLESPIEDLEEWKWTRDFYNRQYRQVEERGELLLGYILALEGMATLSEHVLPPILEAYGPRGSKFVKIHIEEDQDHLPHAIEHSLSLDCKEKILENFVETIAEYRQFIRILRGKEQAVAA